MKEIDKLISTKETEISRLEKMFSNPDSFERPQKLTLAGEEYQDLQRDIGILWQEWQNLAMRLDEIGSLSNDTRQSYHTNATE